MVVKKGEFIPQHKSEVTLDKRKKYLVTLDVETAPSSIGQLVYDFSYVIHDKQGNIMAERAFIISEVFDSPDLMKSAYYAVKIPIYRERLANGTAVKVPLSVARKYFLNALKVFNITDVYAYNCSFDSSALRRTWEWLGMKKDFFPTNINLFCIYHMACQVLCTQRMFFRAVTEHKMKTEKGNISTSAETVYRYISKNYDFVESHTGIDDSFIEREILVKCFKQHKKMDKKPYFKCWQIPQKPYKDFVEKNK